jgi:hypothetical protein
MYFKCTSNIRLHRPFKVVWSPLIKTFHSIWQLFLVHLLSFFFKSKKSSFLSQFLILSWVLFTSNYSLAFCSDLIPFTLSAHLLPVSTCLPVSRPSSLDSCQGVHHSCLFAICHLVHLKLVLSIYIITTEYTQRGNGRFLANIPSWWKKPALAGEGWGVHAHPLSLYLPSRTSCSVRSSWEGRYTPPFHLYMYSVIIAS